MGNQRRIQTAGAIYLVSNECIDGQPFMEPTAAINTIIRNNLAWAASTRGIDLYVYNFRPSSMHMIVSAPLLNLGKFMGDFQGLTARQINAEIGRTGKFFAGRYRARRLLDNNAILEAIGRIFCDEHLERTAARLAVSTTRPTPVSSWTLHETGEALVGFREDRARFRDVKRANPDISDALARRIATTKHTVELARLPLWNDKPHRDYHRAVCRVADSHRETCGDWGTLAPTSASELGCRHASEVAIYLAPMCVATEQKPLHEFSERRKRLNFQYECASVRLRRERGRPRFPRGMIPPHKTRAVGAPRPGTTSSCSRGDESSMTQLESVAVPVDDWFYWPPRRPQ